MGHFLFFSFFSFFFFFKGVWHFAKQDFLTLLILLTFTFLEATWKKTKKLFLGGCSFCLLFLFHFGLCWFMLPHLLQM